MGRNSRKAHLIGGLAMGGKTSSNLVEHIQAPVLLIHGEKDRTTPLEQGQRLCAKLRSAGKNCELLIIPGAGHVFNFRDEEKGQIALFYSIDYLSAIEYTWIDFLTSALSL